MRIEHPYSSHSHSLSYSLGILLPPALFSTSLVSYAAAGLPLHAHDCGCHVYLFVLITRIPRRESSSEYLTYRVQYPAVKDGTVARQCVVVRDVWRTQIE